MINENDRKKSVDYCSLFKSVDPELVPYVNTAMEGFHNLFNHLFNGKIAWEDFVKKLRNCTIVYADGEVDVTLKNNPIMRGYAEVGVIEDNDLYRTAVRIVMKRNMDYDVLSAVAHEIAHALCLDIEPYVKSKSGKLVLLNSLPDDYDFEKEGEYKPHIYTKQGFYVVNINEPEQFKKGFGCLEGGVEFLAGAAMSMLSNPHRFRYSISYFSLYKLNDIAQFTLGIDYLRSLFLADDLKVKYELDRVLGEGTWREFNDTLDEIHRVKVDEDKLLGGRKLEHTAQNILFSYFYADTKGEVLSKSRQMGIVSDDMDFKNKIATFERILVQPVVGRIYLNVSPQWAKQKEGLNRTFVNSTMADAPSNEREEHYKVLCLVQTLIRDGKLIDVQKVEFQIVRDRNHIDQELVILHVDGNLRAFELSTGDNRQRYCEELTKESEKAVYEQGDASADDKSAEAKKVIKMYFGQDKQRYALVDENGEISTYKVVKTRGEKKIELERMMTGRRAELCSIPKEQDRLRSHIELMLVPKRIERMPGRGIL